MTKEQHDEMIVLSDCAFRRGDVRAVQFGFIPKHILYQHPEGEGCVSITLAIKGYGQKAVYTKESYSAVLAALGLVLP